MAESLFSPSWYRVAELKPRLRTHARIHRHEYRDQVWYVLEDLSSGKNHRFSPAAYQFIGLMDGTRTVQELWESASRELGDDAPSQDEVIQLLGQLHLADVLQTDITPDMLELSRRYDKQQRRKWMQKLAQPLAVRIPIFDPEHFLTATVPYVRPLFSWLGLIVWASVVLLGVVLAGAHWTDLTEGVIDRVLAPQNLLAVWLAYPLVKAIHELGHAYATKVWGGECHEIGVMLLVLVPVPYVEASSSATFREKRRRMLVAGAGIMVELFLASLALFLWLNVEPGMVSSFAYSVMLIGGVSTLFFNGNPLLRFDGYYVFSDWLEIPNLATRSKRYLGFLVQKHLFRVEDLKTPVQARGEKFWLFAYGVASMLYRLIIMFVIVLFIATKFFIIGALLAIWAVVMQLLVPMGKSVSFVLTNPKMRRRRSRAVLISTAIIGGVIGLVTLVPVPLTTQVEGVLWLPERSQVRAGAGGFVSRLVAAEGSSVSVGDPLVESEDPLLNVQVVLHEARLRELKARLTAKQFEDPAAADVVRREMEAVQADLELARERLDALVVRSRADGVFIVPRAMDLPGRYVRRGELLAYVNEQGTPTVRVAVGQSEIGLVRERTLGIEAMIANWQISPVSAHIVREVPAASDQLPSAALGSAGGGRFAVDPRDPSGMATLENVFQLDVAIPSGSAAQFMGRRVYVSFDHGSEPLALQWFRSARQLFLSHFGV